MWTCSKCGRVFEKKGQIHSCQKIPLDQHFKNKENAKMVFNSVLKTVNEKIGKCQVISLPCCIHLFGHYDFLAALPKKDSLEIRFSLDRELKSSRITQTVPLSASSYKNCLELNSLEDIDSEFLIWVNESFHLKDK